MQEMRAAVKKTEIRGMCVRTKAACVVLAVSVVVMCVAQAAGGASDDDRTALIALYLATGGDDWYDNSGWKDDPVDPDGFASRSMVCTWYGIDCDWLWRDVVYISLAGNNLGGEIECFNDLPGKALGGLVMLDLSGNSILGEIPAGLGDLGELYSLSLNDNHISGSIPGEIGSLSLNYLNLRGNVLAGPVPGELSELEDLGSNALDLRWNALYTDDEELRVFLNGRQMGGDWESTQTTAPEDVRIGKVDATGMEVLWTVIPYTEDDGLYEVYESVRPAGDFVLAAVTDDKTTGSVEVTGLDPGTIYYFRVRTITFSHGFNANDVVSSFSEVVSGTTLGGDLPGISVGDVVADENAGQAVFNISVNPPSDMDIGFTYTTTSSTAAEGKDYVHVRGDAVIPAGQASVELAVVLLDDDETEGEETFYLVLSDPVNASLAVATGMANIIDDETAIEPEEQGDDDDPDNVCFISAAAGAKHRDVRSGFLFRCR